MERTDPVDAVVVGSGFGGAVAAARLAQAGLSVTVLERGRRWAPDAFPRESDLHRNWLWHDGRGLFDVRWMERMVSVQGAGWGGGSLVYANVFARPPHEVFDSGWPAGYDRAGLDPYYDLVAHMLEVSPVAPDPSTGAIPARTALMERGVTTAGLRSASVRPQLAVRFGDPDHQVPNRHGAMQAGCSFVGQCVIGCPQRAKNTLDYNYLHVAERAGAVARTDTEVVAVRPSGAGYAVDAVDHVSGERFTVRARTVFLAAGAVGTTELLLRMRDVTGDLPGLSPRLGERFSGNGDSLTFLRRAGGPGGPDLERGPTITSTNLVAAPGRDRPIWFQLQDGNYPAVLAAIAAASDPVRGLSRVASVVQRLVSRTAPRRTVMTFLLMGRDSANGVMRLDRDGEAILRWSNRANQLLYRAEGRVARAVARRLGARALQLPTWSLLRRAVTVHNLGGVPIGAGPDDGAVDEHGEVFGHPGLVVVDGAALPGATGANPSATIAAIAERRVERFVRGATGDPTWRAPEWGDVVPADVPEDRGTEELRRLADPSDDALHFDERLTGRVRRDGRRVGIVLDLHAAVRDLDALLRDARHPADLTGTVEMSDWPSPRIARGTLSLFPDGSIDAMRYDLEFEGDDGEQVRLVGRKRQHPGNPFMLWPDLTRLHLRMRSAGADARGLVAMDPAAVVRLLVSIRGESLRPRAAGRTVARFTAFFAARALAGLSGARGRRARDPR